MTYDGNNISRITKARILLLMCFTAFFLCALPFGLVTGCTDLISGNTIDGICQLTLGLFLAMPVNLLCRYTITQYIQS